MCIEGRARAQGGLTLIELVMFIVIVSAGVVGILSVLNFSARASADPLPAKQALAIAEALLEEVQQAPFTYCDPDDANLATAASAVVGAGGCAALIEGGGPEAGDTRPYDNVSDYDGLALAPIADVGGAAIPSLAGYSVSVSVSAAALGTGTANPIAAASGDALRIVVTVAGPGGTAVSLEGYRARYAPNAGP